MRDGQEVMGGERWRDRAVVMPAVITIEAVDARRRLAQADVRELIHELLVVGQLERPVADQTLQADREPFTDWAENAYSISRTPRRRTRWQSWTVPGVRHEGRLAYSRQASSTAASTQRLGSFCWRRPEVSPRPPESSFANRFAGPF